MIDLDHFKSIKDAYGHESGDVVLRAAAASLRAATREADIVGRWGGEEFVVVLPEAGEEEALAAAERICAQLAGTQLPLRLDGSMVTASVGVATLDHGTARNLLARADEALYRAKDLGRDCVVVADPPSSPATQRV